MLIQDKPLIQENPTGGNATSQEPIPGYQMLERIGRGGYGEVWKTLAPGGVPKAIKIIYGDDSSRLATELRSLNRIKDIRHPFLLSIERIEQTDELLAIVTELGDKNLQQYFEDRRAEGLPGIPQNELLGMMRDVADALDYIYQEYALQHLDIKPANLLMFGRRLKVADFGLVKNIYERSASLVHGLTPTYAAPEIFEGRPTRASDQYSLAVLYQEMLTGVLPFDGMNAARLATQHLREAPDLSSLPTAQQPIIARALSKDPLRRYCNCMELVEELTAAARQPSADSAPAGKDQPAAARLPVKPSPLSQPFPASLSSTPSKASTARSSSPPPTQSHSNGDTNQPGIVPLLDHKTAPTIVIGIGGTAGKALQRLRLRIADRLDGVNALPAFKMLFLDVDHEALNEANRDHQAWSELETVPTPMRSSAEYREQGHLHRRWLSRRWLFNVPRSLRTDGLRPLGRLALVSNAKKVLSSLRSAIGHVTSACPGTPPRVLLVASISGGTGSGMLLDLAYAARHELRTAGFPDVAIDGVLLHSTPVGPGRDKAVLNAVATLGELEHFSAPGGFYPGEPLLEIPSFHGNNQTFTSTQFLHLGDNLDGSNWLRATDNVAELLYCRLSTNLDQAQGGLRSPAPRELPTVDLMQVQQIGGYAGRFVDDLGRQLCVDLIDNWCGSEQQPEVADRLRTASAATLLLSTMQATQNSKYQQLTTEAEAQVTACGVDVGQLIVRAREVLHEELKISQREFLEAHVAEVIKSVKDDVPDHEVARLVIAGQDRAVGLNDGERPVDHSRPGLFELLHSRLSSQAMPIASRFLGWVCDLIDQPTAGVDAARHAAEAGRDFLRGVINVVGSEIQARQSQQTASRIQLMSPPAPDTAAKKGGRGGWLSRRADPRAALAEKLIEHGLNSFEELIEVSVHWQLRAIEANVLAVIDELLNMWHELKQLGRRIGNDNTTPNADRGSATRYEQSLQKWLLEFRPRMVQVLRTRMEQDVLSGPKKLQRYLQQQCNYDEVLGRPLRNHARQVVLHSIDYMLCSALQRNAKGANNRDMEIHATLAQLLREPWTLEGGEAERVALVVPADAGESELHLQKSPDLPRVPILPAPTNSIAVCRKRPRATIQAVIHSVTHGQDNLIAVAANLHTRIDVEWQTPAGSVKPVGEIDSPSASWSEFPQTVPLAN